MNRKNQKKLLHQQDLVMKQPDINKMSIIQKQLFQNEAIKKAERFRSKFKKIYGSKEPVKASPSKPRLNSDSSTESLKP